ncbi:MAG: hypothetical protein F6K09_18105, partial [Merismopedia sp. SIO2A8]|nr:hypothetical protein [Merismopedia sp. SIO2A8]
SLAINPVAQLFAAGCSDGSVKLWKLGKLELQCTFQGHSGQVIGVAFSPNGQTLISGSADGTIRIWHLQTGQQLNVLTDETANSVTAIAISTDGELIASGSTNGTIRVWQSN